MSLGPNVLVFASGDSTGGGSGFQELVEYSRTNPNVLYANIVGVISNHENGGVRKRADKLGIPFVYWPGPYDEAGYKRIAHIYNPACYMLSGWVKKVKGLAPERTINIHPGWLATNPDEPHFGGQGMYGHHVHEATIAAYREGRTTQSAVTMHFVTGMYDQGPVLFRFPVLIRPEDTPETLGNRVNQVERAWQSYVLNLVVNGNVWLASESGYYVIRCKTGLDGLLPGMELGVRRCKYWD